jgi:two-component system NtrC family sensor kinase
VNILSRQPIRRQLLTAICVLLAPLIVAVLWSANRTRHEREADVSELAASVAAAAAAQLDQYFAGLDAMASVLVRHPAVIALEPEECDRLFSDVLGSHPLLTHVLLAGRDGSVRGVGVPQPGDPGEALPSWALDIVSNGRSLVTEISGQQGSGKAAAILGYPVFDRNGTVVGALGLGADLSRLQMLFARISAPEGSVVTLLDRNGRVLARTHDADRWIGTRLDGSPVDSQQAPRVSTAPDGVERVYGNHVVERGPWLVSVGIPASVVSARLAPLWRRNITIVSSAALVLLALGAVIAWQTSLHLNRLRLVAQQIANGDLSPPNRRGVPNRELAELQDAFIMMAASLRDTRDALDRQVEQERKMNEALQSLQRQVVRQERLAAVGLLVSGVAHELNNPLQAILGTAELLERQPGLTRESLEEISFVKTQSGRAREIIRNLSRFSSQQSGPPSVVDLRDVIAEVVQLRHRDLDNLGVALDVELQSARKVYANFTELEQVILNFVINAQQSIETSEKTRGRILIRLFDAGKKVRVEVHDDGPGVKPEDEPKLFQPFFTTKPVGKGTGLGLSVSYGIIDSYGGVIGYNRNSWGGATFFFELSFAEPGADSSHDGPAVLQRSV